MSRPRNRGMPVAARTLADLARRVDGRIRGEPGTVIEGLASLEAARPGTLSHLSSPAWRAHLATTRASAVLVRPGDASAVPTTALVVDDPYFAYAKLSRLFERAPPAPAGVHPRAVVAAGAALGEGVSIGPGAVIGERTQIGARTRIDANCVLQDDVSLGREGRLHAGVVIESGSRIGDRVEIHANAVIGADGFGYARAPDGERFEKIAQLGGVELGAHVEIGAGTTIDRGALGDTVIETGVKIDNQVQIGHNTFVGRDTLICGCVGVVGSSRIGRRCVLAGGVGIGGDGPVELADGVVITGMTHVSRSLPEAGVYSSGTLATASRRWKRNALRLTQLDALVRRVSGLERRVGLETGKTSRAQGDGDAA